MKCVRVKLQNFLKDKKDVLQFLDHLSQYNNSINMVHSNLKAVRFKSV